MNFTTQIILGGLSFPQALRWHDGALWFSDIHAHRVYRLTADGKAEIVAQLHDRTSGLGFLPDGSLLVVSMLDRRLIAVERDGKQRWHADLAHLSHLFIDDMVVDRDGRAYVGSRNGGNAASRTDSLILVKPDGKAATIVSDLVSPNGAVITPDGNTLIIAETAVGRLSRFSIAADGKLAHRKTIVELAGRHLHGICRDVAGGMWAGGGTGGLLRIAPDGSLDRVIDFPDRMVLACALGGPDRRTLFLAMTSASLLDGLTRIGLDRSRDRRVDSAGRIEAMTADIPGAGF